MSNNMNYMNHLNHEDMILSHEDINGNIQRTKPQHIEAMAYASMQLAHIFQDNRAIKIK